MVVVGIFSVLLLGVVVAVALLLGSIHTAQANGAKRSKATLAIVTSHNRELAQTLTAACELIHSDPGLTLPGGCLPHGHK